MARRGRPVLNGALLVMTAALVALTWKSATTTIDTVPIAIDAGRSAPPVPAQLPITQAQLPNSTALTETLARPLFSPSRRLPVAVAEPSDVSAETAPAQVTETAAEASRLVLIGRIKIGSRDARALIRGEGQESGKWVSVGGEVGGWRLTRIDDDTARIEKNGSVEHLPMRPTSR